MSAFYDRQRQASGESDPSAAGYRRESLTNLFGETAW
jgi:hypothetical protein